MRLSARMPSLVMNRTGFWIGALALGRRRRSGRCACRGGCREEEDGQDDARRRSLLAAEPSLTRKAKLARARALAMAREMADTPLPRYKVDASGDLVPDLRAAAAIIYDPETNQVLWEENSQSQRSIASITKMMTAIVFLESNPDLTETVTVARSDVFQASTTHLRANDRVTTDDLLHLLLIASDNAAARALARVSPYGLRRLHRADEREGRGARASRARTTRIRRACCRTTCRRRTTWRGSSRYVSGDERIASIMRTPEYTVLQRPPADHVPQHEPPARTRRRRRARGQDRASSRSRATAWRRCCACRRAASRSPSSCSARGRTPAASWKRRISSTGCRARRRRPLFATGTPRPRSQQSKSKVASQSLRPRLRYA